MQKVYELFKKTKMQKLNIDTKTKTNKNNE